MEEKEVDAVVMQLGSHQQQRPSTLMDQYERLSLEIQLNQAILRRSLSEPAPSRRAAPPPPPRQGKRGWTPFLRNALKKLMRPFLPPAPTPSPSDAYSSKRFSRSVRL